MDNAAWIGALAAVGSTVSFAPQAWKIVKTRETKDISTAMYVVTMAAFGLWVFYGFLIEKWPVIVPNTICFILSGLILLMKMMPKSALNRLAKKLGQ